MKDPVGSIEVHNYYAMRAEQMKLRYIGLEQVNSVVYFATFLDENDESFYHSIYIDPSHRGDGMYIVAYDLLSKVLQCNPVIATVKECNMESYLSYKGIPHHVRG